MSTRRRKKSKRHSKRDIKSHKSRKRPLAGKRTVSTASIRRGKHKAGKKLSHKPIVGPRLWLFRVIAATVIPALFFLLIELSLHIAGYGYPATPIVKCKVDDKLYYCDNVKFGWRFFPRNIAQEFDPFIFKSDKPDDTYRIFILGASAAQGTPDAAYSFGRILEVMLQNSYPKVNFEVIVAAMPAINSHVAVEIAKDLAKRQPDLFITYLGNNEVVGPFGAGTVFAPLSANLSLIRMGIALKTSKLGQLLTNLFESVGGYRGAPRIWGGLKMFLEKQVRANNPKLRVVYRHFQRNLEDICSIACKSGAKIILCTVGNNLKDCPPFASEHRLGLSEETLKNWNDIYQKGIAFESVGDYAEAIEYYLAAAQIDDCYADLQFRLGSCYWAMGQYDKAKDKYIKARELDTLRFRADTRINEIIRTVSSDSTEEGIYLLDVAGAFEENSPYKSPGEELFYEHVHLNFKGNYLLARTVFEQVENSLPEQTKRLKVDNILPLTVVECAQALAYNDWARYNNAFKILNYYIKEPPFTNQLYHNERVSRL
ncbi:MAG: tetratricopeptide repeat protein, partial [Planctomycetota bacterium]